MTDVLVVFAKWPEPGRVKTRLAADVGAERAAALYRTMVESTLAEARSAWEASRITVAFAPAERERDFAAWLGRDLGYRPQGEGDLGERLARATEAAFAAGAETVTVIGSDCPMLSGRLLEAAHTALEDGNFVIGPAQDGGYFLIGLPRRAPELFVDVPWSTPDVFAVTRAKLEEREWTVALLPVLSDVDTASDLPVWLAGPGPS